MKAEMDMQAKREKLESDQMQAMMNIQVLNGYDVKRIVTACPH